MGGVLVCESVRVSVYKTPTGLHLSCHVGDLCLCHSAYQLRHFSLIVDDGWNSRLGLEYLFK